MAKRTGRWLQAVAGAVILFFLVRHLVSIWTHASQQRIAWQIRWPWIVASLLITWVMYGVLIWGWRAVLTGWGETLSMRDAARIWTVSNLGTFIPGGVWAIAGMAVLAQQRGVSGVAATGSALVMQLLALATGVILAVALVGVTILTHSVGDWGMIVAWLLAAATIAVAIGLTSERLAERLNRLLRRPGAIRAVAWHALGKGLLANFVAWLGYGLALRWLAFGTVADTSIPWMVATGSYAAAYVAGYVLFFLPGGLGMRETVLATLLNATGSGLPASVALVVASRVVVTADQVGAAIPFLTFWRQRDNS